MKRHWAEVVFAAVFAFAGASRVYVSCVSTFSNFVGVCFSVAKHFGGMCYQHVMGHLIPRQLAE